MDELCKRIRRDILRASFEAGACHLGSALSVVEILVALYFKVLKEDDYFIFSKASGAVTYYRMLVEKDPWKFPLRALPDYLKQYPLASKEVPGVLHSVGSLGMGLGVATGIALADKKRKVYCLISDGELDEGSTWEAIKFAGIHQLDNLTTILDYNKITACQRTNLEPLDNKFQAFGWQTFYTSKGHSCDELKMGMNEWPREKKPYILIAKTIKGKGVSFMEDKIEWHYKNLTPELLALALKENE